MTPPQGWPEEWKGNTVLDFGSNNRMTCEIVTESTPTHVHMQNYIEILKRWSVVWQAAREQIEMMLKAYERTSELKHPLFKMEIRLPAEPIDEGVNWAISAIKKDDGWWNCEFDGWTVDEESSQPYF